MHVFGKKKLSKELGKNEASAVVLQVEIDDMDGNSFIIYTGKIEVRDTKKVLWSSQQNRLTVTF